MLTQPVVQQRLLSDAECSQQVSTGDMVAVEAAQALYLSSEYIILLQPMQSYPSLKWLSVKLVMEKWKIKPFG